MLVLVVGPSGAGKDTLLDAAKQALADNGRFHFVRRVVTRPQDAGGEAHEPATEVEFAQRDFALQWEAHGLRYGIPADAITDGIVTVANVSRTIIFEAATRFPVRVIEVTASQDIRTARLTSRADGRMRPKSLPGSHAALRYLATFQWKRSSTTDRWTTV